MSNKKSRITQKMANAFPEWSDTRSDEQSLGFQLINTLGNRLEDLSKQLVTHGKNQFITTTNLDEIDSVYRYELPLTFQFETIDNDTAITTFATPTVSGLVGNTWYRLSITDNNDIEDFWYNATPDRVSSTVTNSNTVYVLTPSGLEYSPYSNFSNPHLDGKLHVTISGGNRFLKLENDTPSRGVVILTGITRKGTEESETLVFLFDDTKTTTKEWHSITSVGIYGIEPETATVTIKSARFNDGPYLDFFDMEHSISNEKVNTFWGIGQTEAGTYTLDLIRYATDSFKNLLAGITVKEVTRSCELLTSSGTTYTPLDVAVQPFSNNVWTCSTSRLFVYNTDQYYPSMTQMQKKQYDAIAVIEPDNYHKVLNDEVELDYIFRRPIKDIARHRVTMTKPDGTKLGLLNGSTVSTSTDYWDYGAVNDRHLRNSDIVTLTLRGDYIFLLETLFVDGSITNHEVIVSVESKSALKEYSLDFAATGLDFDSDQKLWVLDNNGTKHRIDFTYDNMLIDYDQKIIYVREAYDNVKVTA